VKCKELKISSLGYSTIENIPIYHFDPGHTALRLIGVPSFKVPINFPTEFLKNLNREPFTYSYKCIDINDLIKLAKRWSVKAIFLDGIEPLTISYIDVCLKRIKDKGFHIGARTQGIIPPKVATEFINDSILDFLLVDISPEGYFDVETKVNVYDFLRRITSINLIHVEVVVHMDVEKPSLLVPVINNIKRRDIPLHIKVYNPKGLGYNPFLKLTSKTLDYVYVHAGGFSLLDTLCPNCKNYIAIRERGILIKLELTEDLKCPKCGTRILFRGEVSKMTPKRVIRETRGEVIWYHLKALPLRTRNC